MNSNITNEAQPGGKKNARELRDQVMRDIRRVRDDVDEIKQRLTPGQIIDDAIFYRRPSSAPLDTYNLLQANPIGTSLLTLGTLLLMEDEKSHETYESLAWRQAGSLKTKVEGIAGEAKDKVGELQASVKSHLPRKDPIAGQAPNTLDRAKAKFDSTKDSIRGGLNSAKHGLQDKLEGAKEKLQGHDEGSGISGSFESGRFNNDEFLSGGTPEQSRVSEFQENVSEFGERVKTNVDSTTGSIKSSVKSGLNSARSSVKGAMNSVSAHSREAIEGAKHLDPLTYMVLGAGLGTLTGAALPVMRGESEAMDEILEEKIVQFKSELQTAINESLNTLKNEIIGGVTDVDLQLFK